MEKVVIEIVFYHFLFFLFFVGISGNLALLARLGIFRAVSEIQKQEDKKSLRRAKKDTSAFKVR